MRWRVAAVAVCGLAALAGCGEAEEKTNREPAAARDTSTQEAVTSEAEARKAGGWTAYAPLPERSDRGYDGVLRGTFARLNGRRVNLSGYRGDVVLVVNTATECGFTPQFEGLESLYRKHVQRGFVVLGFPANDFASQEPRSNDEIAEFCKANYGVSFPMFAKTTVAGEGANALFRQLAAKAGAPEWNFNKYLIDRDGKVVARYGAGVEPASAELAGRVEELL